MSQDKNPDSPATTSQAYDQMRPKWAKVQTVLNGTDAMRAAGTTYLPQHENESQPAYDERLAADTLFNVTKLTLEGWVGLPFSEDIKFTDVPPQIEDMLPNVDLLGNDVHVFCRDWFADGVAKAYSHVLVDFPRTNPKPDGRARTLADDQQEGVRPYWIHVLPEQLIFASGEMVNGIEVLREIRIMETFTEQEGFAEVHVEQIRRMVVNPDPELGVIVEVYRKTGRKVKNEDEWALVDGYTISLKVIPLVTFYSDRAAFMLGIPPLADLADINIAHWQSTSDQRAVITVARFPMLALAGAVDDNKVLTVGPNAWLWSPDPQGKFYYVEHTGAAIEAGREDLEALVAQMAQYGAQFLKKAPSGQTATARSIDSAEATSPLQDMVMRFSFALNQVLALTAAWLNLESGGTATLDADLSDMATDQPKLVTLTSARTTKDISRLAYLEQLKKWNVLDETYDIEEDELQIEKENMNMFGAPPPPPDLNDDNPPAEGEGEE